jgi:hypothetical protein
MESNSRCKGAAKNVVTHEHGDDEYEPLERMLASKSRGSQNYLTCIKSIGYPRLDHVSEVFRRPTLRGKTSIY